MLIEFQYILLVSYRIENTVPFLDAGQFIFFDSPAKSVKYQAADCNY